MPTVAWGLDGNQCRSPVSCVCPLRLCRWTEAVKAASALAKLSDTRGLAPQYARLLLEVSRARLGAEPASPVGALPHALRSLAVCESYSLDAIHASAMTHLAEVRFQFFPPRPFVRRHF